MVDTDYFNKMEKSDYKSKDYKVAIHPQGHQFSLKEGQADEFLKLNGFKNATEAKKHGWIFK